MFGSWSLSYLSSFSTTQKSLKLSISRCIFNVSNPLTAHAKKCVYKFGRYINFIIVTYNYAYYTLTVCKNLLYLSLFKFEKQNKKLGDS